LATVEAGEACALERSKESAMLAIAMGTLILALLSGDILLLQRSVKATRPRRGSPGSESNYASTIDVRRPIFWSADSAQ
jgi:hypothetical protein